jgi:phenylpyruvate tautomerase PptA (4-oxalocrotonate tautomerase family)
MDDVRRIRIIIVFATQRVRPMPLVRISPLKGKSKEHIRAVADGVQQALIDAYGIPPEDRFQLIDQHEPEEFVYDANYLGIRRTDDVAGCGSPSTRAAPSCRSERRSRGAAARLRAGSGHPPNFSGSPKADIRDGANHSRD